MLKRRRRSESIPRASGREREIGNLSRLYITRATIRVEIVLSAFDLQLAFDCRSATEGGIDKLDRGFGATPRRLVPVSAVCCQASDTPSARSTPKPV